MAVESVPEPLSGFKRLNSSTYIYDPPTTITTSSSTNPELILLLSWLDAAPRHIARYTRGYQALYPGARILLVTTSLAEVTIHSRTAEAARLAPTLSLLLSLPTSYFPRILLHSFSNGGTYTAHLLARLYLAQQLTTLPPLSPSDTKTPAPTLPPTPQRLPISAQILDSAPGEGHYGRTATALAFGLPQRPAVVNIAGLVLLHVFLALYWLSKQVTGGLNKVEATGRGLLDGKVWDRAVPRCYVYSRTDKMVVWGDVVRHAAESEAKGWKRVSVEEFEGSAHCGHLLVDAERYWGIVERVWGER